jgi:hypothetical protein
VQDSNPGLLVPEADAMYILCPASPGWVTSESQMKGDEQVTVQMVGLVVQSKSPE